MIKVIDESREFKQNGRTPLYWKATPRGFIRVFGVRELDLPAFLKSYNTGTSLYNWFVCTRDFENPFLNQEQFAFVDPIFYKKPAQELDLQRKVDAGSQFVKFVDHEVENIFKQYGPTDQLRRYPTYKNLKIYGVGMPRHTEN